MSTFLSIAITTYKRNDFLIECLDSIFKSIEFYRTNYFQNDSKFEILIFDDNPDQLLGFKNEILNNFKNRDNLTHLEYRINKVNLGDYFNRNQAVQESKGAFLKYIDDDDIIYENTIGIIYSSIKSSNFEKKTYIFYLRDNFRHLKFPIKLATPEEMLKFHYFEYGLFHCSLVSAVFATEILREINGFFCKRFYGDFELLNRIAFSSELVIFPFELGYYRIHENQESGFNRIHDVIKFNYLLITINILYETNLYKDIRKLILKDNFNFLKRGIRKINVRLITNTLMLYFFLRHEKTIIKNQIKWDKYFNKNILLFKNEIN
jgi:glycosyltransferase involved in cell wall biosynthesis